MIAQLDKSYIMMMRPWKLWQRLMSYALFEGRPVTTRGRWINPLVYALYGLESAIPLLKRVDSPIFILGTGRSGTTVLGMILSMHRHVGFLNEPKALWNYIHPHEDIIGSYSPGNAARYRLDMSDATPARIRTASRIYGAYSVATCSKRIVDKYPELIFRVPFVTALFPDAKFIFLVRDGWSTCASIAGWSAQHGRTTGSSVQDWWGVNDRKWRSLVEQIVPEHHDLAPLVPDIRGITDHRARAAVEWIVTMREGLELRRQRAEDVFMLRYEDLVSRPAASLNGLLEFCSLGPDPTMVSYAETILRKPKPVLRQHVPPFLQGPFMEMQRRLGYD